MNIPKKDLKIETMRGKGPGGQHKNKTDSMVRITHLPTGIVVTADGRNQHANRRAAMKAVEVRLRTLQLKKRADNKKTKRDLAIQDHTTIRTYDYSRDTVKDHRTGKTASIKEVLGKGNIDKLK